MTLGCKWDTMNQRDYCKKWLHVFCYNPNFGLSTKAKAYKGANQQWSLRVTFHVPGNVKKCEGMNPHTPKWVPTLGVGVPMDSQNFKGQLQESKLIELKSYLYQWKVFKT
jgi:hypothetical protein